MNSRNYPAAETAFQKYLEVAPDDARAYANMSAVLYTERKYAADEKLLEKRIINAPDDGDAHARLGAVCLVLHQPERAVPELEKATSLLPKYEFAQFALARAYLAAGQNDKAGPAFTRALELNDSDAVLNSAAYQLAQHNTSLDLADRWAERAVTTVELEINGMTFQAAQSGISGQVSKLAAYWDTLGWVKFQERDLSSAEKYILAAWQLRGDTTIGLHLGRVYEAQGRTDDAVDMFSRSVEAVPSHQGGISDDEKEAHEHMTALLWNAANAPKPTVQPETRTKPALAIRIANPDRKQGIAQYAVMIGPGSSVADIQALDSDNPLATMADAVRPETLPQSFPDEAIKKIPRVGMLTCPAPDQPCTFTLLSVAGFPRIVE
jgi:tetratricopeptide (TPR) repeat protein